MPVSEPPFYQNTSVRQAILLFTLAMLTLVLIGYGLLFFQLRQLQLSEAQRLLNNMVEEMNHKIDHQEYDFNELIKTQYSVLTHYDVMIFTPTGKSIILSNTSSQEGFALPLWQMTAENKNTLNYNATGIEAWYELHNQYQLYVNIRPTAWLTWFNNFISPLYFLPTFVFFIILLAFTGVLNRRTLMWRELINFCQTMQVSMMQGFKPLPISTRVFDADAAQIGQALNRFGFQLSEYFHTIHELNHRQQMLIDNAPVPLFLLNRKAEILYFNEHFSSLFMTAFQPNTRYMLTDFVAGNDKLTQQKLFKLSENQSAVTLSVTDLQLSQHFDLRLNPLYNRFGKLQGFSGVLEIVGYYHTQLEQAWLVDRQQQEKLASFDKLWAVLGHELRTPLSGIIGMLALLDEDTDNLSPEQKDIVATLQHSGNTMLQLLNDMLDMAKLDAGKLQLNIASTDILKLSRQVCALMVGNARRQQIDLLYHAAPTIPRNIMTDDGRLRQIMLNLLSNAIKFTKQGYVALLLDTTTSTDSIIQKKFTHPPTALHWLKITIKDTGIGISLKEQQKLFSFFNQANDSISRQFGGTGLGLAISNSFAQMMGGFIHLHSEVGKGSEFQVYLPLENPGTGLAFSYNTAPYRIQVIVFVKYALSVGYIKAIFDALSIPAIVHLGIDDKAVQDVNQRLDPDLTPFFIIDDLCYVGYEPLFDKIAHFGQSRKILSSMETERSIDPSLLAKFDGFLQKPMNMSGFMAEMARLYDSTHASLTWQADSLSGSPRSVQSQYEQFLQQLATRTTHPAATGTQAMSATPDTPDSLTTDRAINLTTNIINNITNNTTNDIATATHHPSNPANPISTLTPQKTILVAEDNAINQTIARKNLEKLGYAVLIAENGLEALTLLQQHRANIVLILMDHQMPLLDGLETTRRIRANHDSIPIIALTANAAEEDKIACLSAGMDSFLTKPLTKEKIADVLKRFMI